MTDIELVQAFYGFGTNDFWTSRLAQGDVHLFRTPDFAVPYWNLPTDSTIIGEKGPIIGVLFDDLLTVEHASKLQAVADHNASVVYVPNAVPRLTYAIDGLLSVEQHRKLMKTGNSYTKGAKYNELTHRSYRAKDANIEDVLARKRKVYPDMARSWLDLCRDYDDAVWWMLEGEVTSSKQFVYEMLCMVSPYRVYGLVVNVSDDPLIRNGYKPYIVSHYQTLLFAWQMAATSVDFGLYFDYKGIFGAPPVMTPGLRWRT
jgi:hypothetical protein